LAESTIQRIPTILDAAGGAIDAFDGLADTIANPPEGRPLRQAIGIGGQKFCDAVGAVPADIRNRLGGTFWTSGLLCKPYWDNEGYDAPVLTPPFTGGQCVGASYVVRYQNRTTAGNFGAQANASGTGPVIGPYLDVTGNVGRAGIQFASGKVQTLDGPAAEVRAPAIVSITRQGGLPDNCGNPPGGTYGPGANPPPTPTFPPGEEPGLDPTGQPYFTVPPIDSPIPGGDPIEVPPLPIVDNPAPAPPGPGEPGTPVEPGDGEPAEGEGDDDEELVGVKVEVLETPENANKFQDITVDVWRGIGYVRMGYPGRLGVDMSAATAQSPQFYHAQQRGLTNWEVLARNGFRIRATPYFRKIEQ